MWTDWAAQLPVWAAPPAPLLIVSPHPDDETLGAGGLIATALSQRRSVVILSLTDGEAARPEVPNLAQLRQKELARAMQILSPQQPRIVRLGLPDGELARNQAQIERAIHD